MTPIWTTALLVAVATGEGILDKVPVPDAGSQLVAASSIKVVFQEEYKKRSPAERLALAKKLLDLGKETSGDPVKRFVLLREARDLAVEAGDVDVAWRAIDALAEGYLVDDVNLKTEAFLGLSRGARKAEDCRALSERAVELIGKVTARDNYDLALRIASEGVDLAQKAQDASLLSRLKQVREDVQLLKREYSRIEASVKTLEGSPEDPPANLALGKFHCFFKGDWEKGLPFLAKSGDPALKLLAAKELARPVKGPADRELGEGWADLAEKQAGPVKTAMQQRAIGWLEKAMESLAGLERVSMEKQILKLRFGDSPILETQTGGPGIVLGGEQFNVAREFTIEFWFMTTEENAVLLTKRNLAPDGSVTLMLRGGYPVVVGDAAFYKVEGASSRAANDGKWHHLAAVKSDTLVKLYQNGEPVAEIRTRPGFQSQSPWILGPRNPWGAKSLNAKFAKVRISKVARYPGPFRPRSDYAADKETLLTAERR